MFFRFCQNHDQLFLSSVLLTFSVLSFLSFARMQFIQKHFCEHSQPIYVALANFARKLLHKLFCKSFAASTLAFGELSNIKLPTYQRSGLHHIFQTIISLGSLSSIFQVVTLYSGKLIKTSPSLLKERFWSGKHVYHLTSW